MPGTQLLPPDSNEVYHLEPKRAVLLGGGGLAFVTAHATQLLDRAIAQPDFCSDVTSEGSRLDHGSHSTHMT